MEHTNYHLSSILTDNGYGLEKRGVVGECGLTGDAGELCREGKMQSGNLPEQYGWFGFRRFYLYRCYQKNQEEKSSGKEE